MCPGMGYKWGVEERGKTKWKSHSFCQFTIRTPAWEACWGRDWNVYDVCKWMGGSFNGD